METDCTYIPYQQTGFFSELACDYIEGKTELKAFYHYEPHIEGVEQAIRDRSRFPVDRAVLTAVLRRQYTALPSNPKVSSNIESLLNEQTFTICTAHQPNLLTGYLYFFYKILHAVKMADELNERYPQQHFVPVYYMGSEDNDLDELGQFWYDGRRYRWDAAGQRGAVGRMRTDSLKPLLNELFRHTGPPGKHYEDLVALLEESYLKQATIAEATRYIVHALFGQYGLIIIDPDEAELKKMFVPVLRDELFHHTAFPIVSAQSERLAVQYKAQAYPRPINLFYLKDDIRERIEEHNGVWSVLNTDLRFSEMEMEAELKQYPERFSPNVILRGLFQETILPNICFIGGGAELAYWLQLKPLFEQYSVFYPVIYLRQSVQIINEQAQELMRKTGLKPEQVFESREALLKQAILQKRGDTWSVAPELQQVKDILDTLTEKAAAVDSTLKVAVAALVVKMERQLNHVEQKIYRAEKRKENVLKDRLERLKEQIAPGTALQERRENFITYYLQEGFAIFDRIFRAIKPFDNTFLMINFPEQKNQ